MRPTLWAEFEHALRRYGDRVGLHLDSCAEFVVADVAIAWLGAVRVPVNPLLTEATVAHVLATAAVRALVVGLRTAPTAAAASRAMPGIALLEVGGGPIPLAEPPSALPSAAPQPSAPQPDPPAPPVGPADTAAVYPSGGTTGLPTGVVHTQASAVAVHYAHLLAAEIGQDERLLLATPLAHAAGIFAQSALIRGATVVLLDGFDAHRALDALEHERITWTCLVPIMIYRLLDADRPPLRHALRTVVYGAAPISPARLAQALEVFGPVFIQLYGQTQCPSWGTRLARDDHDPARPQHCREVEHVLVRHPSVRRVAVIGVPHDDWDEAVHAVVVPAADPFSAADLPEWARAQLAGHARPKSVQVVTDLPETPIGKVDKKRLREQHWAGHDRGIA